MGCGSRCKYNTRNPIIRVSVDHGTGFDLAGKGESNELSLVNSIDYATKLAVNKK